MRAILVGDTISPMPGRRAIPHSRRRNRYFVRLSDEQGAAAPETVLIKTEKMSTNYKPFTEQLRSLVEAFGEDRIMGLIKRYMD